MARHRGLLVAAIALGFAVVACSSNDDNPTSAGSNGIATGPADTHCTAADGSKIVQSVNPTSCHPSDNDAGEQSPSDDDAGAGGSDYGDTMFGDEGDDDDCKYHMKWSAAGVAAHTDVTFAVVATQKVDGTALQGSPIRLEVFLNDTHPGPNTNQSSTETSPGNYRVGPVQFDASGRWTVRFHFHEECEDTLEDSPHAHAAFFVDVP